MLTYKKDASVWKKWTQNEFKLKAHEQPGWIPLFFVLSIADLDQSLTIRHFYSFYFYSRQLTIPFAITCKIILPHGSLYTLFCTEYKRFNWMTSCKLHRRLMWLPLLLRGKKLAPWEIAKTSDFERSIFCCPFHLTSFRGRVRQLVTSKMALFANIFHGFYLLMFVANSSIFDAIGLLHVPLVFEAIIFP